jgi:hypothetical protein
LGWEQIAAFHLETAAVEVRLAAPKFVLVTAKADWGSGQNFGVRAGRHPLGRLEQHLEWLEVGEFPAVPGSAEPKALGLLATVALPARAAGPRPRMCNRVELPVADGLAVQGLVEEDSAGTAGFEVAEAAVRYILYTGLAAEDAAAARE